MLGKETLLRAIAGKNRGILATETDRLAILAAIAQLEERNPNPNPLDQAEKLDGNWRLLYTSSEELLNIDRFPLIKLGQIYQWINVRLGQIYNVAEVGGIPYLEGLVSVTARFERVSARRVNVKFNRLVVGPQRWMGYQNPRQFVEEVDAGKKWFPAVDVQVDSDRQQGWLEITYLDDDLRIGRGNQGSVFVLTKVSY